MREPPSAAVASASQFSVEDDLLNPPTGSLADLDEPKVPAGFRHIEITGQHLRFGFEHVPDLNPLSEILGPLDPVFESQHDMKGEPNPTDLHIDAWAEWRGGHDDGRSGCETTSGRCHGNARDDRALQCRSRDGTSTGSSKDPYSRRAIVAMAALNDAQRMTMSIP